MRRIFWDPWVTVVAALVMAAVLSVAGGVAGVLTLRVWPGPACVATTFSDCLAPMENRGLTGAVVGLLVAGLLASLWGMRWWWLPLSAALSFASLLVWAFLGDRLMPASVVGALAMPIVSGILARPPRHTRALPRRSPRRAGR